MSREDPERKGPASTREWIAEVFAVGGALAIIADIGRSAMADVPLDTGWLLAGVLFFAIGAALAPKPHDEEEE